MIEIIIAILIAWMIVGLIGRTVITNLDIDLSLWMWFLFGPIVWFIILIIGFCGVCKYISERFGS